MPKLWFVLELSKYYKFPLISSSSSSSQPLFPNPSQILISRRAGASRIAPTYRRALSLVLSFVDSPPRRPRRKFVPATPAPPPAADHPDFSGFVKIGPSPTCSSNPIADRTPGDQPSSFHAMANPSLPPRPPPHLHHIIIHEPSDPRIPIMQDTIQSLREEFAELKTLREEFAELKTFLLRQHRTADLSGTTDSHPAPPPLVSPSQFREPPPKTPSPKQRVDLPRFDGTNPTGWLFKLENYFDYYETPEDQRFRMLAIQLDGPALLWFQALNKNFQLSTWERFKESLLRRFGRSPFRDLRGELAKIQQTSTVEDYYNRFEEIATQVDDVSPAMLQACFESGLRYDLHLEVRALRPKSLDESFQVAKLTEDRLAAKPPPYL